MRGRQKVQDGRREDLKYHESTVLRSDGISGHR